MFKNMKNVFLVSVLLLSASESVANAAEKVCMPIGGLSMPNFVLQKDGTITIVAPLTGSVATASGTITT